VLDHYLNSVLRSHDRRRRPARAESRGLKMSNVLRRRRKVRELVVEDDTTLRGGRIVAGLNRALKQIRHEEVRVSLPSLGAKQTGETLRRPNKLAVASIYPHTAQERRKNARSSTFASRRGKVDGSE